MRTMTLPLLILLAAPVAKGSDATCGDAGLVLPAELTAYDVYAAKDVTFSHAYVGGSLGAAGSIQFSDGDVLGDVVAGQDLYFQRYTAGLLTAGGTAACLDGTDNGCLSSYPARIPHDRVVGAMTSALAHIAALPSTATTLPGPDGRFRKTVPYGLSVLDLDVSALGTAGGLDLDGPAGAVVIVRIHGAQTQYGFTVTLSATLDSTQVLFAFLDATTLTLSHTEIPGTILAPKAKVTVNSAALDGAVYAGNLDVTGVNVKHAPFYCGETPTGVEY